MNIMQGYITWAHSNCWKGRTHSRLNPTAVSVHTILLPRDLFPLSLSSSPSCSYFPPLPGLFPSIFLSSSSSCPSLFILLSSASSLFSICLSLPISFPTSQWLRGWQFAGFLDSWSSVPATWVCFAFTFTATLVLARSLWSSQGDLIPSTLLVYSTLERSFSSHPILVDTLTSRTPVKTQKPRPFPSLPLKLAFWFVNWDQVAALCLLWIKMDEVWFREGKGCSYNLPHRSRLQDECCVFSDTSRSLGRGWSIW